MIRRILEIKEGIWGIFRSPRQITTSEICIVIDTKAEFSNSFSIHSKYFYVLNKLAFSYIFLFNKTLAYFSAWFQNINRCFSLHPCRYSSKSRQSHTLSEYFAYSCISFVQLIEIFSYFVLRQPCTIGISAFANSNLTVSEHANKTGHYPLWDEVTFIDRDPH